MLIFHPTRMAFPFLLDLILTVLSNPSHMYRNYKVAKPEWVVESVKANRLLPWHSFSSLRTSMPSLTKFGLNITKEAPSTLASAQLWTGAPPTLESTTPGPQYAVDQQPIAVDSPGIDDDGILQHQQQDGEELDDDNRREESQTWDDYGLDEELLFEEDEEMGKPIGAMDLDDHDNGAVAPSELVSRKPEAAAAAASIQVPTATSQKPIVGGYKVIPPAYNPYAKNPMPPPMPITTEGNDPTLEPGATEAQTGEIADHRHPTLIELSVPWNRLNSSVQPGFVEKFYQSSRLHYLSTWKAKLRDITADIQKDRAPVVSKFKNRTIM